MRRSRSRKRSRRSESGRKSRLRRRYRATGPPALMKGPPALMKFLITYVRDIEKWSTVANQYKKVAIITMKTAKAQIEKVCKKLLNRDIDVYSRDDLELQSTSTRDTLFAKIHKALDIAHEVDQSGSTKVYFTDDMFEKEDVILVAQHVWKQRKGSTNKDWLVYTQVNAEYDTNHVKKESSCDIWCIDFDKTITTYSLTNDYMSSLMSIS